jgi:hypothetical protein
MHFLASPHTRIGDARSGGSDMLICTAEMRALQWTGSAIVMAEGEPDRPASGPDDAEYLMASGLLRLEERDGEMVVVARTDTGEYLCDIVNSVPPMELDTSTDKESFRRHWQAMQLRLHAALWQRQRATRESALPVPIHASALQHAVAAGRETEVRKRAVVERIHKPELKRVTVNGSMQERVTVDLVVPKSRAMKLRLRAEHPVFPSFSARPKSELPLLVGDALARALSPRAYQAVVAGLSHVYANGGVKLDTDGELPRSFRLAVMETMGMPSSRASKAQREIVQGAMSFLVHAEMLVQPTGKGRNEYVPLLSRHSFYESTDAGGYSRPAEMRVNDALLPDMMNGRRWLVPEALFQVADEADRDGVLRLMGFQVAYRLGMGTESKERLELMLRRAGLWEWWTETSAKRGAKAALDALRATLDRLRALPWIDHSPADIVGGAVIEGERMADAVLRYEEPPAWVR